MYHSQASAFKERHDNNNINIIIIIIIIIIKERHDKRPGIKQCVSPSKSQGHLTSILLLRLLAEDYEMNVQHAQ